jgi:TfoX/Sxy family transcriptional regulator of competence genes
MAFDDTLAARIRTALSQKKGVEEKKMFGGIVFMLNGNMLVGVWKDSLIVRLGDEQAEEALLEPHVKRSAGDGWSSSCSSAVPQPTCPMTNRGRLPYPASQ